MNATKGTPRPWEASNPTTSITRIQDSFKRNILATLLGTMENREANAALIVKAVNNHDALVEALEGLFRECTMVHKYWGEESNQLQAVIAIQAATAALNAAREG